MGRPSAKKSKTLRQATKKSGQRDPMVSQAAVVPRPGPFIPPEILSMILDELLDEFDDVRDERPQLSILARTSRLLQVEAERRLYERVRFPVGEPEAQKIAAILQSRAAPYVRFLGIENYGVVRRRGRTTNRTVSALPFARMTNLSSLYVTFDSGVDFTFTDNVDPELFRLLDRDLAPNILQTFANSLPVPPSYLHFLERQPCLECISSNYNLEKLEESELAFSPATHPYLVELEGSSLDEKMLALMHRNRIRRLRIFVNFMLPENWALYTTHLVRLDVLTCQLGPVKLCEVVRCCPRLQILEFTVAPQWNFLTDMDIFDILRLLPELRVCAITLAFFDDFFERMIYACSKCEKLESFLVVVGVLAFELLSTGQKTGDLDKDWEHRRLQDFDVTIWTGWQDARIEDLPVQSVSSFPLAAHLYP
ncbi:hypothetical protein SISSUDRAFT_1118940 [Sistotremastrum suecicum HHB10207 ss-3]|uniref:F-box domain-containing protein n=1 Tax=Sistotremastrum suecicum HHB10207 ss-3 TaxID=1314776 RepID=A0A166EEW3_9AGAM|nr:hypothetical protein SISSUDRAFT_1118940 [Sistotremastrum suecicum HHB10207 ss-3]